MMFLEKADHAAELTQMKQLERIGMFRSIRVGMPLKAADDDAETCGPGLLCHKAGKLTPARNDADIFCHSNSEGKIAGSISPSPFLCNRAFPGEFLREAAERRGRAAISALALRALSLYK